MQKVTLDVQDLVQQRENIISNKIQIYLRCCEIFSISKKNTYESIIRITEYNSIIKNVFY